MSNWTPPSEETNIRAASSLPSGWRVVKFRDVVQQMIESERGELGPVTYYGGMSRCGMKERLYDML